MKELFIIRHAKSSWSDPGLSDFDRPLNSRGENDAPFMGDILTDRGFFADGIYSSTANRAITTARVIAEHTAYKGQIIKKDSFYHASASDLLKEINRFDDAFNRVFMFGHNPGFTYLAEQLTNEGFGNVPTCGIVGVRFDFDSWALISSGTGDNFYYGYPKKYK